MRVRDVMSVRLLCVGADTPIRDVAAMLVRNRISGVPVVENGGHVVGIVSESDLQPTRDEAPRHPVACVADVMTRPVVTLTEDDTVTQAARVLQRHRIKRAPVLRDGVIVGMVTRGDLLRPYLRTDSEILTEVEELLSGHAAGLGARGIQTSVRGGIVTLEGLVDDRRRHALLIRMARSVDGVVDVRDRLQVA